MSLFKQLGTFKAYLITLCVCAALGLSLLGAPIWAAPTEKVTICHRDTEFDPGQTLTLKQHKAAQHLYLHDFDTEGECAALPPGSDRPQIEILLNVPLAPGEDFGSAQLSPDGKTVVYLVTEDSEEDLALYSVAIGGGPSTRLNPILADADVGFFRISPDSATVLYRTGGIDEAAELYSVAIGGGFATRLNGDLIATGDVLDFTISPDSTSVVYVADQDTDEVFELYSVAIGGGSATKLNPALPIGGNVRIAQISPDSASVVYRAEQSTGEESEFFSASTAVASVDDFSGLYSVPIDGSATAIKLNPAIVADGQLFEFAISPNGATVVYRADQDTDQVSELYSVAIGGGSATKLNPVLPTGADVRHDFAISRDSTSVVYLADQDTNQVVELYSVAIGGGSAIKLNPEPVANGAVLKFAISRNSATVVYLADQETDQIFELYSVAIDGESATKLNGTLVDGGEVIEFQISADSASVVYLADQETNNVDELYSVAIGGGSATKLNPPLPTFGDVLGNVQISADSTTVVYQASQDIDNIFELYSVPIDGSQAAVKRHSDVIDGFRHIGRFDLSSDSQWLVFRGILDTAGVTNLYSSSLTADRILVSLQALMLEIEQLNLAHKPQSFLLKPLNTNWKNLNYSDPASDPKACGQLDKFELTLADLIDAGELTEDEGDPLNRQARDLQILYDCPNIET